MKNTTVTRVGVLSVGKLFGTINFIIALAAGLIAAIVGTASFLTAGVDGFFDGLLGSLAIILAGIILYPLVMFALGWLYGVLASFIFNVVIGMSGGVTMTVVEEVVDAAPDKK